MTDRNPAGKVLRRYLNVPNAINGQRKNEQNPLDLMIKRKYLWDKGKTKKSAVKE